MCPVILRWAVPYILRVHVQHLSFDSDGRHLTDWCSLKRLYDFICTSQSSVVRVQVHNDSSSSCNLSDICLFTLLILAENCMWTGQWLVANCVVHMLMSLDTYIKIISISWKNIPKRMFWSHRQIEMCKLELGERTQYSDRAVRWTVQGCRPGRCKIFILSLKCYTNCWVQSAAYQMCTGGPSVCSHTCTYCKSVNSWVGV